jgi:Ulp1 protease family, C-terminal catalytic domain
MSSQTSIESQWQHAMQLSKGRLLTYSKRESPPELWKSCAKLMAQVIHLYQLARGETELRSFTIDLFGSGVRIGLYEIFSLLPPELNTFIPKNLAHTDITAWLGEFLMNALASNTGELPNQVRFVSNINRTVVHERDGSVLEDTEHSFFSDSSSEESFELFNVLSETSSRICFYCCINRNHWRVVYGSPNADKFRYTIFDSMSQPQLNKREIQSAKAFLGTLNDAIHWASGLPVREYEVVGESFPQQKNSDDCGAFAIYGVKCLQQGKYIDMNIEGDDLRFSFLMEIVEFLESKVTPDLDYQEMFQNLHTGGVKTSGTTLQNVRLSTCFHVEIQTNQDYSKADIISSANLDEEQGSPMDLDDELGSSMDLCEEPIDVHELKDRFDLVISCVRTSGPNKGGQDEIDYLNERCRVQAATYFDSVKSHISPEIEPKNVHTLDQLPGWVGWVISPRTSVNTFFSKRFRGPAGVMFNKTKFEQHLEVLLDKLNAKGGKILILQSGIDGTFTDLSAWPLLQSKFPNLQIDLEIVIKCGYITQESLKFDHVGRITFRIRAPYYGMRWGHFNVSFLAALRKPHASREVCMNDLEIQQHNALLNMFQEANDWKTSKWSMISPNNVSEDPEKPVFLGKRNTWRIRRICNKCFRIPVDDGKTTCQECSLIVGRRCGWCRKRLPDDYRLSMCEPCAEKVVAYSKDKTRCAGCRRKLSENSKMQTCLACLEKKRQARKDKSRCQNCCRALPEDYKLVLCQFCSGKRNDKLRGKRRCALCRKLLPEDCTNKRCLKCQDRISSGDCFKCGKPREDSEYKTCRDCRALSHKQYEQKMERSKKEPENCRYCRSPLPKGSTTLYCISCLTRRNNRYKLTQQVNKLNRLCTQCRKPLPENSTYKSCKACQDKRKAKRDCVGKCKSCEKTLPKDSTYKTCEKCRERAARTRDRLAKKKKSLKDDSEEE